MRSVVLTAGGSVASTSDYDGIGTDCLVPVHTFIMVGEDGEVFTVYKLNPGGLMQPGTLMLPLDQREAIRDALAAEPS